MQRLIRWEISCDRLVNDRFFNTKNEVERISLAMVNYTFWKNESQKCESARQTVLNGSQHLDRRRRLFFVTKLWIHVSFFYVSQRFTKFHVIVDGSTWRLSETARDGSTLLLNERWLNNIVLRSQCSVLLFQSQIRDKIKGDIYSIGYSASQIYSDIEMSRWNILVHRQYFRQL